ncbi:MAG: hypothetical protein FJW56_03565 [Actinobacteria bacterium]|nr:hypothetical protein [Actinomycetota bacterium]
MNDNLTTKERFLKLLNFEPVDRTLNWEFGYWGGTVKRWYSEGLPKIKGLPEEVSEGKGISSSGQPSGTPSFSGTISLRDKDISSYFNFDENFTLVPYNYWIFPRFEKKIISEDERYIELYDTDGIRKRILKDDSSMPFWIEWPVKNSKDWQQIKEERFNFNTVSKRYYSDIKEFAKKTKNRTFSLGILGAPAGFFGTLRFLLGEENLFMLYYDNPYLIKDILGHLCQLWIYMAEELLPQMDFDIACFWEDMSGKQGSLISPATFKEFMTPGYKELIGFLKSKGIKYFVVDTDGRVDELIPLFLECGVNFMYPFEQQAGNDMINLRKSFPELVMMGGFNKNVLSGTKEAIDKELEKIPALISAGGYIPCADHLIPPNCSWENFKYYRDALSRVIFSTRVNGRI